MSCLKISSRNVLLPGFKDPQPASITIDTESGKITDISLEAYRDDPNSNTSALTAAQQLHQPIGNKSGSHDNISGQFLDVGEKFILPGLVE